MQENEIRDLIYNYLDEVKKYLPWWIKNDKKELSKVLNQLETHIWEKAEDLSEYDQPTEDSVRLALAHMGRPYNIVQEYEQGKTPKVFISMELWPIYKTIMIVLIMLIIGYTVAGILILVMSYILNPVDVTSGNLLDFLDELKLQNIFTIITTDIVLLCGIIFVTILFFWLSKRGYYPDSYMKYKKRISQEKKRIKRERKREELIKMGMPISAKTGEPLKPFINRGQYIITAIFILGLGFSGFLNSKLSPYMFTMQIILSLFSLIVSISCIIEAFLGNKHIFIHQMVNLIEFILILLIGISILIIFLYNPNFFNDKYMIVYHIVILFFLFLALLAFLFRIKKLEKYRVKS